MDTIKIVEMINQYSLLSVPFMVLIFMLLLIRFRLGGSL